MFLIIYFDISKITAEEAQVSAVTHFFRLSDALNVAVNAFNAAKLVGMPECRVFLAEAVYIFALPPNRIARMRLMKEQNKMQ